MTRIRENFIKFLFLGAGLLLLATVAVQMQGKRVEEVSAQPTFVTSGDNTVKNRLLVRVDWRVFKLINTDNGQIVGSYVNQSEGDFVCDGNRLVLFDTETRDVTVVDAVNGNVIAVIDAGNPSGTIFQIEEWSCNPDNRWDKQLY